jgi:hypothetical protein
VTKYQISHTSFAFIHKTSARLNPKSRPKTKIVAITDISYAPIALDWRHRLVSLGYDSSQVVVVAADDASLQYFNQSNLIDVKVEPMLHPSSPGWPVAVPRLRQQTNRRRLFATRWVYVLHQLRNGYSILLTDVDNIFVRHLDMAEFENSGYDVIHAYCHNFPVEVLSMGFVACGGMMWLRGNYVGGTDVPAVKYVEGILEQCGWPGLTHLHTIQQNNANKSVFEFHPSPLMAETAYCDDQKVINSFFFGNSLNYTWGKRPKEGFWKGEAWGVSLVTGHTFGFWSVNLAYRGPVDGYLNGESGIGSNSNINGRNATVVKQCPNLTTSWVAMPYSTLPTGKKMDASMDRLVRVKQWYEFCRNAANVTTYSVGGG